MGNASVLHNQSKQQQDPVRHRNVWCSGSINALHYRSWAKTKTRTIAKNASTLPPRILRHQRMRRAAVQPPHNSGMRGNDAPSSKNAAPNPGTISLLSATITIIRKTHRCSTARIPERHPSSRRLNSFFGRIWRAQRNLRFIVAFRTDGERW